jgi:hypothetical protein
VAEAILFSAAHPKRDMYVGAQAKVLKMLGDFAPRFMDKLMEVVTDPGQIDPARPSKNAETSALYQAGYGLHEKGSHQGWFRTGSLYVKMQEHPLLAAAAVAGLGLALGALRKGRQSTPAARRSQGGVLSALADTGAPWPSTTAYGAAAGQPTAGRGERVILAELEAQ